MYTLDEETDVNFQILAKLMEMLYVYLLLVSTEAAIVVYFFGIKYIRTLVLWFTVNVNILQEVCS